MVDAVYEREPARDSFQREVKLGYEGFLRYARHMRPQGTWLDYQDVVQEAILILFREVSIRGMPDNRLGFRKWATLAMNWAYRDIRKFENVKKRRGYFTLSDLDGEVDPDCFFVAPDSNPGMGAYERELFAKAPEIVIKIADSLPKSRRSVVSLHMQGKSVEDIAAAQDLTLCIVKRYIANFRTLAISDLRKNFLNIR